MVRCEMRLKSCCVVLTRSRLFPFPDTNDFLIPVGYSRRSSAIRHSKTRPVGLRKHFMRLLNRLKLGQHFVRNMRHVELSGLRLAPYVYMERLRSVPVEDASMLVKPCSIICDIQESYICENRLNESSEIPRNIHLCTVALPPLPLPLAEYISPSPSRIYDQVELYVSVVSQWIEAVDLVPSVKQTYLFSTSRINRQFAFLFSSPYFSCFFFSRAQSIVIALPTQKAYLHRLSVKYYQHHWICNQLQCCVSFVNYYP
ncbi:hypothetical protein EG68_10647 [Paragonimus skrjabini miyazakii]|uniref:Uncharacterized protein n=1 Tax=Paragonimus skrjabini miyazakii TaxID=59628 RepID=A0A8S9YJP5_9TREM|nr:hypothetical protein EG68_10647 [Paragonimus skrjabini miyazakii]